MDFISARFNFLGFEPDLKLKKISRELLSRILREAPSDASPIANFAKTRAGYECMLKVCSQAGTFTAKVAETDPVLALDKIGEMISDQLRRWRKNRSFFNNGLNNGAIDS